MADNYDRVPRWGVRTNIERLIRDVYGARQSLSALLGIIDTRRVEEREYTLVRADANKVIVMLNDSPSTVFVPAGVFRVGTVIGIEAWGEGVLTVSVESPESPLAINSLGGSLELAGQYAPAALRFDGMDENDNEIWILTGALA